MSWWPYPCDATSWPAAAIFRTNNGHLSATQPSTKNVARALQLSRISIIRMVLRSTRSSHLSHDSRAITPSMLAVWNQSSTSIVSAALSKRGCAIIVLAIISYLAVVALALAEYQLDLGGFTKQRSGRWVNSFDRYKR